MEENKQYDDIILEKDNKSEKLKKILLRVIALVILFLIVMIVMKLINSDDNTTANADQGIFPSEPESNFENMQVTNNESSNDEFAALRAQLQGIETNTNTAIQNPAVNQVLPPEPAVSIPTVESESVPEAKPTLSQEPKPATPSKPAPKKEEPKAQAQNKPQDLFANVKTQTSGDLPQGAYIQIFSVSKFDPKSRELTPIAANGYEYKLYKSIVNNKEVIRVLVGPFAKDKLSEELTNIREKIRKEAFVFQIK